MRATRKQLQQNTDESNLKVKLTLHNMVNKPPLDSHHYLLIFLTLWVLDSWLQQDVLLFSLSVKTGFHIEKDTTKLQELTWVTNNSNSKHEAYPVHIWLG